jgi:hypothetical protein
MGTGRSGVVDAIRLGGGHAVAGLLVRFGRDLVLIRAKDVERIDLNRNLVFVAEHLGRDVPVNGLAAPADAPRAVPEKSVRRAPTGLKPQEATT